jgi:hypothetical protein
MHSNKFTLTIPCVGTDSIWSTIEVLFLQNNYFTGAWLEQPLFEVSSLHALDMSNTLLSGSISSEWLVNADEIQVLHLNNNGLVGSIPSNVPTKPRLLSIILASNCFSGTLSEAICSAGSLTQVIFDGLHSSPMCVTHAIAGLKSSGIILPNCVYGVIPSCVFELENLTVLHLGANNLNGLIAGVTQLSEKLSELVLARNQLTGKIPPAIWQSNVTMLDMSLNQFQGTIPSNALIQGAIQGNLTVSLNVNQL